jgi:type II secretory pathway pseudopilin PulG
MRPWTPRVRTDKSLASSLTGRFRSRRDDRGFVLLESVIAIGLITVIMTAMTTFFVTTMTSSAKQRAQQAAVQLADSGIQKARSLGATGAYAGRTTTAVNTQWATAPAITDPVRTWLTSMQQATDSSGSATVALPTIAVTQNINNVNYSVNYYIGWCWRTTAVSGDAAACVSGSATGDIPLVRTVVAVTWAGQYCPSNACSYITASLLNGTADSAFNTNAPPPSAPALTGCLAQNFAVPMFVTKNIVASGTAPGCTVVGGIPIIRYSSPDLTAKVGLLLGGDGTISGTPTPANVTGVTVTITVTDGFKRTSSQTILIKVFDTLKATEPSVSQVGVVGRPFSVTPKAISGSLSYIWAPSGGTQLPAGLTMPDATTGVITGTPTASFSTQPISLMVTDQLTGQSDPITFNLTVYGPLTLTAPPAQLSTIGKPLTLALSATGGAPGLVWTASGLPAGLAIDPSTGVISGTPTAFVVTTVSVTVTDLVSIQAQTVTFQWTINAGACTTVFTAAAGSRSLTIGAHAGGPATVQLILVGGGGGSGDQYSFYQETLGGNGGKVIATYVLPASATPVVLTVFVGGGGTKGHGTDTVAGGVGNNAGGKGLRGGAAGGGASTLLLGSAPLTVAGGGGGGADGGSAGSGRDGGDGSGTAAGVDGGADGGNGGLKGTNDGTTPLAGTSRGAAGTVITATGVGHGGDSANGGGGGGGGFGPGGGGGSPSGSRDGGGGGGGAGYLSATIFGSPTDVTRGVGGGGTNPGAGGNNNSSGIPGSFSGTICGSTPTLG